jgi:hypothetical protein
VAGRRNDPSLVCTYELKKEKEKKRKSIKNGTAVCKHNVH